MSGIVVGALFAKLFVQGASWTFPAENVVDKIADNARGHEKRTTKGTITCTVSAVSDEADGKHATLTCNGLAASYANGTYVLTNEGLWRIDDSQKPLVANEMLIGSRPKAGDRHIERGDDGEDTYRVKKYGDGWCFGVLSSLGDESGWMLCVSAKKGLIGGNSYSAGAESDDLYFGKTPRY